MIFRKNCMMIIGCIAILFISGCNPHTELDTKTTTSSNTSVSTSNSQMDNSGQTVKEVSQDTLDEANKLNQFIEQTRPPDMDQHKVIKEDVDGDGNAEYIIAFGDKPDEFQQINVIGNKEGEFSTIGKLKDPIVTAHINTDMKIMSLDQTSRKFIVVYAYGEMYGAEGFVIYELQHNQIEVINYNYPDATGSGTRKLEDINEDGIFETVSYYYFRDTQKHTVMFYQKYDGTGPEQSELLYLEDPKEFIYPADPTAVIQNYLEDMYLMNRFEFHIQEVDLFTDTVVSQTYDFEHFEDVFNFSSMDYGGLELNISEVANQGQQKTFLVQDGSDMTEDDDVKKELTFILEKKSGKWKIENIKKVESP
ncbi:hypothetical protein [Paenibacillus glacialis]|uniref:Lipoprotein n=1 Tax=Paenibacillus glacialis TaxID=494026 RepID=A0A168K8D9_9BACL|nr:hypothetical protein [Paenibacillus glacialis]OAB41692.1 hypothetical protein PGLA_15575 [Paenibacillus glacialis]